MTTVTAQNPLKNNCEINVNLFRDDTVGSFYMAIRLGIFFTIDNYRYLSILSIIIDNVFDMSVYSRNIINEE